MTETQHSTEALAARDAAVAEIARRLGVDVVEMDSLAAAAAAYGAPLPASLVP
jgi:hypothetical protein